MKKIVFLSFILIFFLSMGSCGLSTTANTTFFTGSIEIGYITEPGQRNYPGYVAFTIKNPVLGVGESTDILFEYGHDYNEEEYERLYVAHTITVFVSSHRDNFYRSRDEYTILYEEVIENFVTDEYLVSGDTNTLYARKEFPKSFELSISSEDIPYEYGALYFVITKPETNSNLTEPITYTEFQFIYFRNVDGELIFYN